MRRAGLARAALMSRQREYIALDRRYGLGGVDTMMLYKDGGPAVAGVEPVAEVDADA
jgi:hypothetical protein